jgi:penicillin amidase
MPINLTSHLPRTGGRVSLAGLSLPAEIYRDAWGIPHARAGGETDACYVQGFFTAQDRLWQMEYDRRRGSGRWAEVVGKAALDQDVMMRRFRLVDSAQADYGAVNDRTRKLMDAYAAGVNAWIETAASEGTLPVEYSITDLEPETWRPWDGLVVFKARHILMGVFESKIWRARMVRAMGPEQAGKLFPGYEPGHLLILPPGATAGGALDTGLKELAEGAAALNRLSEMDGGSNSWVVSGTPVGEPGSAGCGTATGKPILAGDSHRALDTPNAYYQNRVACPEFDVIGLSFPGVPAFPHFGHNPWVCWSVTHTAADYQDLYIEQLREGDTPQYLYQNEWLNAEVHHETVRSNSGREESIRIVVTNHGPIISGGPLPNSLSLEGDGQGEAGQEWTGMAFKYTATESASDWTSILWKMLRARNVEELAESQRGWVDPCNNFLMADVDGNIGYLCRGRIPIRSRVNGWLPVPGWTGEHEWQGDIPFEELPRSINPPEGYIATANNKPTGDDYPHYIAVDFTPEFRVQGVTQGLKSLTKPTVADMAKVHAYRVSQPAQSYLAILPRVEPSNALAAIARERLLAWDGSMDANQAQPAIYSAMRDALLKEIFERNLPPDLADASWHPADRGLGSFGNRLKASIVEMLRHDDRSLLSEGDTWPAAISRALTRCAVTLFAQLGDDPDAWVWDRVHRAVPRHTLSAAHPELNRLLDPPAIPHSGDGDTPLQGGYSPAAFATVTSLSVARYAYDTANWDDSLWVVPLGSSGHPGSPHYCDQSETWRRVEMLPMRWDWPAIIASSETTQTLEPG